MMNRSGKSKQEKERKKNTMKERHKLRNWDPGKGKSEKSSDYG